MAASSGANFLMIILGVGLILGAGAYGVKILHDKGIINWDLDLQERFQEAIANNEQLEEQNEDLEERNNELEQDKDGLNSTLFWSIVLLAVVLVLLFSELGDDGPRFIKIDEARDIAADILVRDHNWRYFKDRKYEYGGTTWKITHEKVAKPKVQAELRDVWYIIAFAKEFPAGGAAPPGHWCITYGFRSLYHEHYRWKEIGMNADEAYEKHKLEIDKSPGLGNLQQVREAIESFAEIKRDIGDIKEEEQ